MKKSTVFAILLGVVLTGFLVGLLTGVFSAKKQEGFNESYLFSSYDSATGEWVIIRTSGTSDAIPVKVRIVAECQYFKLADKEPLRGKDVCSYQVGRKIIPKLLPDNPADFIIVTYQNDLFDVTEGKGAEQTYQSYKVKSATVIQN